MPNLPVALQLWSVREEMNRDFSATVAEVARIGYAGVELAGFGNLDSKGAKTALDSAGLKVSGMHVGIAALRTDPEKAIADALMLGTRHVVVPFWSPEQFVSVAAVEKIAEELNRVGEKIRAAGLQLSYHNHAAELKLLEGRPVFEWLLNACEPRNVTAEVDVYWVKVAGYSPDKFLRDHGSRVKLIHLKDETELGSGPVDYTSLFATVENIGAAEWYIVEQEKYNHAPLTSVRLCLEQLKKWGKA